MLRTIVKFLLITEAFTVLTFAFGWWIVPLVAFILALALDRVSRPIWYTTVCAAAAWGSLLLLDAMRGPLGELAVRFGGVMRVPAIVILVITLIFPALLAWSAATIGATVRDGVLSRRTKVVETTPAESAAGGESSASSAQGVVSADV